MKSAREILLDQFKSLDESFKPKRKILIVGDRLFDRLVREGYDVIGLERCHPQYEQPFSVIAKPSAGGPRNRWGELR